MLDDSKALTLWEAYQRPQVLTVVIWRDTDGYFVT